MSRRLTSRLTLSQDPPSPEHMQTKKTSTFHIYPFYGGIWQCEPLSRSRKSFLSTAFVLWDLEAGKRALCTALF